MKTLEDAYDDLLGVGGVVYHPPQVVALAKKES